MLLVPTTEEDVAEKFLGEAHLGIFDFENTASFVAQENALVGFRIWEGDAEGNLQSIHTRERAWDTTTKVAKCTQKPEAHINNLPVEECTCGLYSQIQLREHLLSSYLGYQTKFPFIILGAISLWGKVVPEMYIYQRSEFARIRAIASPHLGIPAIENHCQDCKVAVKLFSYAKLPPQRYFEMVAQKYGVPLLSIEALSKLT